MSPLERAISLASSAHAGQVDEAGQPYILQPVRVMLRMTGDIERIAAVLHDIVEDTPLTLEQLRAEGFSVAVVEAVAALTKLPGESRMRAAVRAATNPLARAVKLADTAESMDLSRISSPTAKDFARIEEYKAVRELLLATDAASQETPSK